MSAHDLEPTEHWREPSDEIEVGDVFVDVPLLNLKAEAASDAADQIYLPTRRSELALLLKVISSGWWFVPLLTKESFTNQALFEDHLEQCIWGNRPGWFLLPPFEGYPALDGFSVVFAMRPTVHRKDAFEGAEAMRVASLTETAYEGVCQSFLDGFTADWV